MSVGKNTSPTFASKISQNYFMKENQEIMRMGFEDISIFKILKNGKIDYYFSNEEWEDLYIKSGFLHADPIFEAFYKTNKTSVPWFAFPEENVVMKSRRDFLLKNGITLVERDIKEESLIINLGTSKDKLISQIMDSKDSLGWLFCLKDKICQKLLK